MNRDIARRNTARTRVAAIVILAIAGAVVALPLPGLRAPSTAVAVIGEGGASESAKPAKPAGPPLDTMNATGTLWRFGLTPADPEPVVASGPSEEKPANNTPAPAAAPPAGWRYIGSIVGPRGTHALLERDGRQVLGKVGDEIDGGRILVVEDGQVVLAETGGGTRHIKIADRASRWSGTSPVTASRVGGGRPGMPPTGAPTRVGASQAQAANQGGRPPVTPPPRPTMIEFTSDEEREKYQKYLESGGEEYRQELYEREKMMHDQSERERDGGSR